METASVLHSIPEQAASSQWTGYRWHRYPARARYVFTLTFLLLQKQFSDIIKQMDYAIMKVPWRILAFYGYSPKCFLQAIQLTGDFERFIPSTA